MIILKGQHSVGHFHFITTLEHQYQSMIIINIMPRIVKCG